VSSDDPSDRATVERTVARALPDLMSMFGSVEALPDWYDDWDAVTPTSGMLDHAGTRFTLVRFRDATAETAACVTLTPEHPGQLRWVERADMPIATLVTFDLAARDSATTLIRYTRELVEPVPDDLTVEQHRSAGPLGSRRRDPRAGARGADRRAPRWLPLPRNDGATACHG
jgi:hypothetical protein